MRWILAAGLAVSGCMPLVRQPSCLTSASTPLVRTLSWKPTWGSQDVDLAPDGNFYFSPSISQVSSSRDDTPADVLLKVTPDGAIQRIRTGPKVVPTSQVFIPEEPYLVPQLTPGYLAAVAAGVWISDGIHQQLRFLQTNDALKLETKLSFDTQTAGYQPGLPLFTDAQGRLYGSFGCAIYQLEQKPFKIMYRGESNTPEHCGPNSFLQLVAGPDESFFDTAVALEMPTETGEVLKGAQIYRIQAGKAELWAGSAEKGFKDGPRTQARFSASVTFTVARDGTLYVADTDNHAIRKISPTGLVSTLAGNGHPGQTDGDANTARFDSPYDVVMGPCHRLYVFDKKGIREISLPPSADSEHWGPAESTQTRATS